MAIKLMSLLPSVGVQHMAKQAVAAVVVVAMPATVVSAAQSDRLELVGIGVGMTVEQVRGQLQQRKLQVGVNQGKFANDQGAFVTRLSGTSPGNGLDEPRESIVVQFAAPPNEARAISVMRLVLYPSNQGPSVESVGKAMTERFGNPIFKPGNAFNSLWLWLWGANGPVADDRSSTCRAYLQGFGDQGGMSISAMTQEISAEKFSPPLKAGCTSGAYATVQGDSNGIRVQRLMSVVVDFDAANKAIRATSAHISKQNEAAGSRERDAAKRVKPEI
jgi:hypothetical protein